MSLTLIGYGFVGKAVYNSLKDSHDMLIVDPKYTTNKIQDKDSDGYIICVPTPMRKDGRCEMSHVNGSNGIYSKCFQYLLKAQFV